MIVFDVEADNLLEDATKIHCLSYTADGSSPVTLFKYDDMRKLLLSQQGLIGHNIIGYDIPLLEKLLGIKIKARLFDTLPMSWVLNYNRPKHGLDSFGEDFGIPKPVIDDWKLKKSMPIVVQRMSVLTGHYGVTYLNVLSLSMTTICY